MTITISTQVTAFVAAVRAHLADLPADTADDLVDGLDADLAAQEAEGGPASLPGDPVAYAEELRRSAGLPDRTPATPSGLRALPGLVRASSQRRSAPLRRWLARQRWWGWALARARELAPGLWLVAAWVAYQAVHEWSGADNPHRLPGSPGWWLVLAALVVGALELGRRVRARTLPRRGLTLAVVVAATLVWLPAAYDHATAGDGGDLGGGGGGPGIVPDGLWLDGAPVGNVFPYDAQGRPLTGVQLFADDGRPLSASSTGMLSPNDVEDPAQPGMFLPRTPVPLVRTDGRPVANAFPYRVAWQRGDGGESVYEARPPRVSVPPLSAQVPLPVEPLPTDGVLVPEESQVSSPTPSLTPSPAASPAGSRTATGR